MKKTNKIIIVALLLILAFSVTLLAACDSDNGADNTSYTITYNLDGGINHADNPSSYTAIDSVILKNPTRDGYAFVRWEEGNTISKGSTGNKTFTAVWAELYNITYILGGGTNHPDNPEIYTSQSPLIPLKNPTRDDDYVFVYWEEGNIIPAGSTGDKTFTAVWAENVPTAGLKFTSISGGYSVSKGTADTSGIVIIPAEYNDNPVIEIANMGFKDCTELKSIIIPDSVTNIGYDAFYECISLTNITIPDGVIKIGYYAFYRCSSLVNIKIPSDIKSIEDYAFAHCNNLLNVVISDGVTHIKVCAFYDCNNLTSIIIPNSVTNIGDSAFSSCINLESITIQDGVNTINDLAFAGCEKLANITISAGNSVFKNDGNCIIRKSDNFLIAAFNSSVIPNYILGIENFAFATCSTLTSIIIPDNVTDIGYGVFANCINLTQITVSAGNITFKSDGNCIIRIADNALIAGCKNSVIPDYILSIENYAFYGCGFKSINIPNSVISIGSFSFVSCIELTSIIIHGNVANIGFWAFDYCINLTIYSELANADDDWNYSWNNSYSPIVWGCTLSSDKTYVESFIKTENNIENPATTNDINAPYRQGYTFKEWNTEANGTGTAYAAADITTAENDTILYAIWIKN